jgi:hypothetical protein
MESSLARKQLIGAALAGAAMAVVAGVIVAAPWLFISILPYGDDTASRLVFLAHWLLLPGFTLLAGVVAASRRGFYADTIDGTRTPALRGLEIICATIRTPSSRPCLRRSCGSLSRLRCLWRIF